MQKRGELYFVYMGVLLGWLFSASTQGSLPCHGFCLPPQLKLLRSTNDIGRTFHSLPCQKVQARGTVCPKAAVNLKTYVTESCF